MFTLSVKSDYGLLLLTLLAKKKKKDLTPISLLAKETNLPYSFLSRIASQLANSGILKSKEGVGGGYRLAKNPKDVTLAQVIEVLEGPLAPTKCTYNDEKCKYEHICSMVDDWRNHLRKKMWTLLNSYTLKNLIS